MKLSKRAQKIQTPWRRVTTQIWAVLLISWGKFPSISQTRYPDLGSDASSVWNFCARFSNAISRGIQWQRRKKAFSSGYLLTKQMNDSSNVPRPENNTRCVFTGNWKSSSLRASWLLQWLMFIGTGSFTKVFSLAFLMLGIINVKGSLLEL